MYDDFGKRKEDFLLWFPFIIFLSVCFELLAFSNTCTTVYTSRFSEGNGELKL